MSERALRATQSRMSADAAPASRPFSSLQPAELDALFETALRSADGRIGAHCIHELSMRGTMGVVIDRLLERLWAAAADRIPDWLPTIHVEWLPIAYEIAGRFQASRRGRTNVYLILLDYADSHRGPHGVYVGISRHAPAERFEQHKLGIRSAGSVLRRGLEPLLGPTGHLQGIARAQAQAIEEPLAEALRSAGVIVKGGH